MHTPREESKEDPPVPIQRPGIFTKPIQSSGYLPPSTSQMTTTPTGTMTSQTDSPTLPKKSSGLFIASKLSEATKLKQDPQRLDDRSTPTGLSSTVQPAAKEEQYRKGSLPRTTSVSNTLSTVAADSKHKSISLSKPIAQTQDDEDTSEEESFIEKSPDSPKKQVFQSTQENKPTLLSLGNSNSTFNSVLQQSAIKDQKNSPSIQEESKSPSVKKTMEASNTTGGLFGTATSSSLQQPSIQAQTKSPSSKETVNSSTGLI